MRSWRIIGSAMVMTLAAGALTGCSGDEKPAAGPTATMIAPGRPGEPNKTITTGPKAATPPTAADVEFVRMMIPHHEQAVQMSALAPQQAGSVKIKALADRIDKAQAAEISSMQSWLKQNRQSPTAPAHGGHAMAPAARMPGMATPAQLTQLQQARGAAFDRLFIDLMITHHQGALAMARSALAKGRDVVVLEMAKDVLATQNAEINRMKDLR